MWLIKKVLSTCYKATTAFKIRPLIVPYEVKKNHEILRKWAQIFSTDWLHSSVTVLLTVSNRNWFCKLAVFLTFISFEFIVHNFSIREIPDITLNSKSVHGWVRLRFECQRSILTGLEWSGVKLFYSETLRRVIAMLLVHQLPWLPLHLNEYDCNK